MKFGLGIGMFMNIGMGFLYEATVVDIYSVHCEIVREAHRVRVGLTPPLSSTVDTSHKTSHQWVSGTP